MKKALLVYGPFSGDHSILEALDGIIGVYQENGYILDTYRLGSGYDLEERFDLIQDGEYDHIIASGGDGTVNIVVNEIMRREMDVALGVLPAGTANDFAKAIGMNLDLVEAAKQIVESDVRPIDVGQINDKYFINVASAGMFTNVSQNINDQLKNALGKISYFIKGVEEAMQFTNYEISMKGDDFDFNGRVYLFLIFNGRTAGNINLAYKSSFDDGLFDIIVLESVKMTEALSIFVKFAKGDHLEIENTEDSSIKYYTSSNIKIETNSDLTMDVDGESGPDFPIEIKCLHKALKLRGANLEAADDRAFE